MSGNWLHVWGYVTAAYTAVALGWGLMVAASVLAFRRTRAQLERLEAAGNPTRSAKGGAAE
ncbi:hypothetical protein E3E11_06095 [Oecophyllibacter saccharovorans]|uniref:hypothetical protein n=1 Tax=Oecophyllibacter saccharovorans TaxID=2558360 RepID=UPI0011447F81|nr:hypothetical protein [Oecophyllibacter saccharovorans]QDH15485.1 hypothetical protein E3E11_06095 [Oecophyllibacter saccharovorans]